MKRLIEALADPVLLFNTPPAQLARIVRSRWRHQNRRIYSPFIHDQARLSTSCVLSNGVVVGAGVELGQRSYLNRDAMVFSGRLGDFCSVGYGSIIGPAQHPAGDLSTSPQIYRDRGLEAFRGVVNEYPEPPQIGCDVWIGNGVTILQGVSIGHGAIIGAGAVVTHSVAPYQIVGGVPARVIRPRFEPAAVEFLLRENWWDRVSFERGCLTPASVDYLRQLETQLRELSP